MEDEAKITDEHRREQEPINVNLTIDVGHHLSHLFKRLFPKGENVETKLDAILANQEKIMAEIDDLNAKLDAQGTAIDIFNTTLQSAVAAIVKEIQQLVDAAQSATDLAALKAKVAMAGTRVQTGTDAISAASATLQSEVDALNADDPAA